MMADPTIKKWHDMFAAGPAEAMQATMELINAQSTKTLPPLVMDPKFAQSVWLKNTAISEKYNEPDASRPSSATSGPRTPAAATTCTAT